jgi:hypothetical protein
MQVTDDVRQPATAFRFQLGNLYMYFMHTLFPYKSKIII